MLKLRSWMLVAALALVAPALSSSATPQGGPPPDNDRVPNRDLWQLYPRWTRTFALFPNFLGTQPATAREMAVQEDGTVHLLLSAADSSANPNVFQILYSHSRPEGRTKNGFSAPFVLHTGSLSAVIGDIAAGTDGRLTAAYSVPKTSSTGSWFDLHARQFDPVAGSWGAATQLTTGSDSTDPTTNVNTNVTYGPPTLAYDAAGNVHLLYGERIHSTGGSPFINNFTQTLKYALNLGGTQTVDTGTFDGVSFTGIMPDIGIPGSRSVIPVLAVAPDGTPHALWTRSGASTPTTFYGQGPAWSQTLISTLGLDRDITTDEAGGVHIAYVGALNHPTYRFKAAGGTMGSPEDIPFTPGNGAAVIKIAVNARKKPVIVWSNNFRTSFAAKVQNTVADPNGWVEQFGLDIPGFGDENAPLNDISIDPRTGFVYAIYPGILTRMTELNTGPQDAFTTASFGPNTTANVATGNLRFELPLFLARSGIGFSTSFSLIYNSLDAERGTISPGWSTSFDMHVVDNGDCTGVLSMPKHQLHLGEGRIIPFFLDPVLNYCVPPGEFGIFSRFDPNLPITGQSQVTTKTGIKYIFDSTGRLLRMEDTQTTPNTLVLSYTNGLLSSIQDSPSRPATMLAYDAQRRLETVTDPRGNTYRLAYKDPPLGTVNPEPGKLEFVTFNGAPSGQTIKWKFDYYSQNQFDQNANPPLEEHKGLLSKLFTPRGQASAPQYFHQFGYKLDGRVVSSTEPQVASVVNETALDNVSTASVKARREISYVDPAGPFEPPSDDEGATGTRVSPAAKVKDRRGFVTTIEYQSMRCLADRIRDPLLPQVLRRFFDTFQQPQSDGSFITAPQFRNLKKVIDREGNTTLYTYTFEETGQEQPLHVKDNLKRITQPAANASDPAGSGGAGATADTASYTYKDTFARVATVKDVFQNTTTYDYDGAGNLTLITHPPVTGQGQATEIFTYNAGRVATHTASEGGQTIYSYTDSSTGLVTSIHRPAHANAELFQYDLMGNLTKHTLPQGGMTDMTYDNVYRLDTQTPPSGGAGDDPSELTRYHYNEDSQVFQVDGPQQTGSSSEFDFLGRLTKSSVKSGPGLNLVTEYKYDREGNTREVKDPRLKLSTWVYDELGRVKTSKSPASPNPAVVTQTTYNLNGAALTQAVGSQTTTMTYSGRGLVLKTQNAGFGSQSDETVYFEDGTVEHSTHKVNGVVANQSTNGYDQRRRLVSIKQVADLVTSGGFTTAYTLDRNGNRTKVTDPDGRQTSMEYDLADRRTLIRDHNLVLLSRNVYNDNDLVSERRKADPMTSGEITDMTYTYNPRNELKTETDVNLNVTSYFYDARGNLVKVTRPPSAGVTCDDRMIYDLAGRLTQEIRAVGRPEQSIWTYEYDGNSNRTRIIDPRTFQYVLVYDDANRLLEVHYPMVGGQAFVESWQYDDRGNMTQHTDPEGKVATMTYDLFNRQKTEVHVKGGVTIADLRRDYDERGNRVFAWDTVSKILVGFAKSDGSTAYDALSRLTEVNWYLEATSVSFLTGSLIQNGQLFGRVRYQKTNGNAGYDGAGDLTDMEDPQGHRFQYTYDLNRRLDEIRRTPSGGTQALIAKASYYGSGLKKDVTYLGGSKQTWTYDSKYRLATTVLTRPNASEAARIEYEYDERDRRTKAKVPLLTREAGYAYDCQDRLTGEMWTSGAAPPPPPPCSNNIQNLPLGNLSIFTTPVCATPSASNILYTAGWTYDPSGNRLTKSVNGVATSYVYDEQNRLVSETQGANTVSYLHDKNGNQTRRTAGGVEERFTHDYRNRVKMYEKGPVGAPTTSYMYKFTPTDERIAKINLLSSTDNEEWFMYDSQDVTADFVRSTGVTAFTSTRTYVNGRAIDSKIARIETNEAVYFYSGDALGTVHEMIDTAGTIVRQSLYTAWGEDLPGFSGATAVADRHGLSQRENDDESALMHYRARSYDPRLGRFTQVDPLLGRRLAHHFSYGDNNPANLKDPTGLFTTALSISFIPLSDIQEMRKKADPTAPETAAGVTDPQLEKFENLIMSGKTPIATGKYSGRFPFSGFKPGGLTMTMAVTLPNLSDFGSDVIAKSKLTYAARHELKHTLALIVASEIIFEAMEDRIANWYGDILPIIGVGTVTRKVARDTWFEPAKAIFDNYNSAQTVALHNVERGKSRGLMDPGGAAILGTVGIGSSVPIDKWKAWVLTSANGAYNQISRAYGTAIDFTTHTRTKDRIDFVYDWLRKEFDKALVIEGVPQTDLDLFKD